MRLISSNVYYHIVFVSLYDHTCGLLLKERTLDSIGHDLWKKYNVISLLWMIRYIALLTNTFTQWILIGA